MYAEQTRSILAELLRSNIDQEVIAWLDDQITQLEKSPAARQLYLAYSLLGNKVTEEALQYPGQDAEILEYLELHQANKRQLSRIYLLVSVLEADADFYKSKVQKLIELADTGELETFLKYLILLPTAGDYKTAAVEALRTNIATVFDAIAMNNPYPALYFNDQQWNQMYLKAAFMQRDLSKIERVKERGNRDLARIISDYAHERWAASREVDPQFWQPVAPFLEGQLLNDLKRLLGSDRPAERKAGVLLATESKNDSALELLSAHPELKELVEDNELHWNTINQ